MSNVPNDALYEEQSAASAAPAAASDVAHSEDNISRWMEYLPQDCVETMIRLGWDVST